MWNIKDKLKKILNYSNSLNNEIRRKLDETIGYELNKIFSDDSNINNKKIEIFKKLILGLIGTSPIEGLKILDSLKKTSILEGDVCEFGVAQGKTSKLIASFLKNKNKKLYLFDSFSGLPSPSKEDQLKDDIFNLKDIKKYAGKMSHPVEKVINELKDINFSEKNIVINKGYFNQKSLKGMKIPEKISFAYLDFDFYEPTYDALNFMDKYLSPNGIIIVDDYDFFSTGVKTAVDKWINEKKEKYSIKKIKTSLASFVIITNKEKNSDVC